MKPRFLPTTASIFALSALVATAAPSAEPRLVIHPTRSLAIENVRVTPASGGWRVTGRAERAFGFARIPGTHLCLEVRGSDGRVISEEPVAIHESPHPRVLGAWTGRASFAQTVTAPPGSTIEVTAHASRTSECRPG